MGKKGVKRRAASRKVLRKVFSGKLGARMRKPKANVKDSRIKSIKSIKRTNNKKVPGPKKSTKTPSAALLKDTNTVALLQAVQSREGWLSREGMISLSKEKGIPGVNIYGVATFYSQFKLEKPGKFIVSICRGTACHVKNSLAILQHLEEMLGIKAGGTTPDGKITLECVNCIGACAKAPAMMINGTVYGELDKLKVEEIVRTIQQG